MKRYRWTNLLKPTMNERIECFTQKASQTERLDLFLVRSLFDLSRSRIQALIKAGNVLLDEVVVLKMSTPVSQGQQVQISIPVPESSELTPEKIPLDIIYEDEHMLVVNKPAGMVVHPAAGHSAGTLVNAVLAHVPELNGIGGVQRPGVVHRLDKDTSGLILLAKDDATHQWLQNQFKNRQVKKTYIALVDGAPQTPVGRIETSIGRDSARRKQMAVVPAGKGRESVSEYKILQRFPDHTLIEVHPHTGRTHQIRVHMAFIGCPIVGDKVYGHKKSSMSLKRHFLHARDIEVILPGEESARIFTAPLPAELNKLLEALQSQQTTE